MYKKDLALSTFSGWYAIKGNETNQSKVAKSLVRIELTTAYRLKTHQPLVDTIVFHPIPPIFNSLITSNKCCFIKSRLLIQWQRPFFFFGDWSYFVFASLKRNIDSVLPFKTCPQEPDFIQYDFMLGLFKFSAHCDFLYYKIFYYLSVCLKKYRKGHITETQTVLDLTKFKWVNRRKVSFFKVFCFFSLRLILGYKWNFHYFGVCFKKKKKPSN